MIAHISEDGIFRTESVAEHTEKVEYLCRLRGERCGIPHIASLCGILHDMGKNKKVFDDYIRADKNIRQKQRGTISHASTGAKYIYDMYHGDTSNQKILVELISYAVAAHHGLFDCVNAEGTDVFLKKVDEVEDYEEACENARIDYLNGYQMDNIFKNAAGEFNVVCQKMKCLMEKFQNLFLQQKRQNAKKELVSCYCFLFSCLQRLVLSILIDADWEATSDFMENRDTLSQQSGYRLADLLEQACEHFDTYMQNKRSQTEASTEKEKEILTARNILQRECRAFARHSAGIYCLPIPTGGGKTLSSLAYALEYCRLHPETERIIYVSPFISITEQNAEVFRQAIGLEEWILEHHSAVVKSDLSGNEDDKGDKGSRFEINWDEPFICTTFVQFMNTLFSDKGETIRRMHRLVNAVVIIDEVQSMPLRCVHSFNYMINFLNAVCNTNIVLCTATQPTLGEAECPLCYSEPKYMIGHIEDWHRRFERVKIRIPEIGERYTIESLGQEIIAQTARYRSILVVLNTKSAVKGLYDFLKARNINAAYLTTNLCAQHRSDRIRFIKKVLAEKKDTIVVVSTNLIEAGVDISFEYVYRSMTGLDGLAQSAGRCNRNGEQEEGVVSLIEFEGENTGNMKELLESAEAARQVLYKYRTTGSKDSLLVSEWMDQYYRSIYMKSADTMNFPIRDLDTNIVELLSEGFHSQNRVNVLNQAYKTAGQAYRVIEDDSFGVIVPYQKGEELIESIRNAPDLAEIRQYIKKAQRYTVNVRRSQWGKYKDLIEPVSEKFPDIYMIAVPGAYREDCGIASEWEPLII